MERGAPVNFRQYIPKQEGKMSFLKIVIALFIIVFLGCFIVYKLNRMPEKKVTPVTEIHGVKIEI